MAPLVKNHKRERQKGAQSISEAPGSLPVEVGKIGSALGDWIVCVLWVCALSFVCSAAISLLS